MSVSLLRRALNSLTRLGFTRSMQTVVSMLEDQWFDLRYGIETTTRVTQAQLTVIRPEHQSEARPYFPTRARAVRYAIRQAQIPTDVGFVDVGSGKGKVMLVAAVEHFGHVKGIEFAPELHAIAQRNVANARPHLPSGAVVLPICADATLYEFEANDSVFFMFNPFGGEVMEGFCKQVKRSLDRHPRHIWLVYADPACLDIVLRNLPVRVTRHFAYGGYEFVVLGN